MKKIYGLLVLAIIAILGLDVYYFFDVLNQQVNFQKQIIEKQVARAQDEINSTIVDFENDILYLLDPNDFSHLFDENTRSVEVIRKAGLFFSKYHNLVNSVDIYDTQNNAFSLSKDSLNYFKTKIYSKKNVFFPDEEFQVNFEKGRAKYNVPIKRDDSLFGKVVVNVELQSFLEKVLKNYHYNKRVKHWIIGSDGKIIYKNKADSLSEQARSALVKQHPDSIHVFRGQIQFLEDKQRMLTATTPLSVMNSGLTMVFSMPLSHIRASVMQKTLYTAGLTFIILFIVILAYLYFFRQLRKKNKELVNSNYRFNSVIEGLEDMIFITGAQHANILFANEAMKNCKDFQQIAEAVKQRDKNQKKQEIKIEEQWYEVRSIKTRWIDDQEVILHALNDLTNQKVSEERVAQSEDIFKQIFQLLPVGIFILDKNQRISQMNDRATELFTINDKDKYLGITLDEALDLKPYKAGNENSSDDENKYRVQVSSGEEHIVYRKHIPLLYNQSTAFLESFTDISSIEEKRQGEALANKAKSEFIANLSHEIRTPLSGVTGMADALLNANLPDDIEEYAEIIKKSADLLQTIINDILDLSKIESGRLQMEEIPFNLKEEMDHAIRGFELRAREKGLKLSTHYSLNLGDRFIGDPFRMKQILTNLLSNAVKFTHEGQIKVSVEKVRERMGLNILLISVEDSGIGIPKHKANKIFESFSQADASTTRQYGGTGLGTTISKQLVEMMGGEIWLESPSSLKMNEEFPGAKFIFTVELYGDEKISKNLNFSDVKISSDLNVLIVDNQPQNNRELNDILDRLNANVVIAANKEEAESQIREHYTTYRRFHLVLVEDREDFNGFETMSYFFHNGISDWCIFVIMTANDKQGNYIKGKHLHADHYLVKPLQNSEIYEILLENFPYISLEEDYSDEAEGRRDLNILLAEDNNINQRVIKTLFKSLGYETEIANNGDEVLNKIREKAYDLIFMDILMPNMDGIQATKALREKGYTMPIIALTGGITDQDMMAAEEAGMDDHLSKPVKLTNLKNILLKWLQTLGE